MKKLFAMLLVLALSLTACAMAEETKTAKVGIIQMADNGAFTDMREGYLDRMAELGYELDVDYQNAQGDMSTLQQICQEIIDSGVDYVVTIATPPTQAFLNMDSDLPLFFISVSNPIGAGVITDMEHPDKNATGTSNAIPVDEMFKLSDQLTPGCKTYGVLYCTSEINSVTTANDAKAYMDANGLQYVEQTVTNSAEVQQAVEALITAGVDAIFVPNDSVVQTAMSVLAELARDAKIPVYGSSAVMVNDGAFATISIGDRDIGAITADMSDQFLQGKAIEDIPSIVVDQFTMVINQVTANAIGVEIPADVAENAVIVTEDAAE